MPLIDQNMLMRLMATGQNAQTTTDKGRALEDLICYVFGLVPGIAITRRNTLNVFNSEEIDVALWNEKDPTGIPFMQEIILVECKNWSAAVGSAEINWFDAKLRNRGLNYGILVAASGITGDSHDLTAAHQVVAGALREQRRLLVITADQLLQLPDTDALVYLIKEKLCDLAVSGTIV
jgi:Restriction endonuclease